MTASRLPVRVAHYDGLGANEIVDALGALEREAGCPSDLGWVSEAMFEPSFFLVTLARHDRLRGYAAAVRRQNHPELQRLVMVPDPDLDETQMGDALVSALLRMTARPPYRELDTGPGFTKLSLLERLGWQVNAKPDGDVLTLRRNRRG